MISGALQGFQTVRWSRLGLTLLLMLVAAGAGAWEQPSEWPQIGTVAKWRQYDRMFYRIYEDAPFLDQSQFRLDQAKQYAKTRLYKGKMDGIGLEDFLAGNAEEQAERRKLAARELKFVADFHQRMQTMIQRTRQREGSGWGIRVNDMTVVGDCLSKLRTAVGLDPSNPQAWHVLAYFAGLVGDRDRAQAALDGAQAALDVIPVDRLPELREAVALDRAWLQYDRGRYQDARVSLETAGEFGATGIEPMLLKGLIAARKGDTNLAVKTASALRSTKVRVFPPNLRSTSFAPDLSDVTSWRNRASNYLQSWILALTWLEEGNTDMAAAAFGRFAINDQYPFAQRFWNDAGWIYEITGRRSLAQKAWSMARINTQYIVYFVYKPYAMDLGRLTGRPGAIPFFLGFDLFYTTGSRLAYAASLVEKVAAAKDDLEKRKFAGRALDELELCRDTDSYPAQAMVLSGQVYYLMDDLGSALQEVEAGLKLMDELGDAAGSAAVLHDLSRPGKDLSPTDIANFFSQSGSSTGRWVKQEDRKAQLAALRKAYADDPGDVNRQALARFLIRDDQVAEGRELALRPLEGRKLTADNITQLSGDDLALVLEADRAEGEDQLALALVRALQGGAADPWNNSNLWTLAGFICLDGGDIAQARTALQRALELDPGNQGLKIQLALMESRQSR